MHRSNVGVDLHRWLTWLVPDTSLSASELEAADWPTIVAASRTHHVAATLSARLLANRSLALVPETERATLALEHQSASVSALVWQRALRLVLPALAAEGVTAVPYKGAALAFLVYADPAARSMSDIDLWIDRDEMPRACQAIERLGFQRKENRDRPIALQERYDGELPYNGRRVGVPLVELHWGVFPGEWLRRTTSIDRGAVRDRLVAASLWGAPVRVLSAEDHLIQIAVHAAVTHQFSQAAVRSLLDLVVIAARGVDWPVIVARTREWRLSTVVGHSLHLAGQIFGQPSFVDAARQLISPTRLRYLNRFANAESILRQDRLDQSLAKWHYLIAAVDRDRDRLHLLARSIWPEREWLGARYGNSGLTARARHLAGAVRGRF